MHRLHELILNLSGRGRGLATFLAGLVSALAFAPFFLWPVLFITLPVLVWSLDSALERYTSLRTTAGVANQNPRDLLRTVRAAAWLGWLFGFGYFLAGLFWIGEAFLVQPEKFAWLLPFALTAMPGGLALFYGAATAIAALAWRPGFARILILALTFSASEWLRGHVLTGFPWNTLGYALTYPAALMQSVAVVGIYGLTIFAVILFAAPATMWVADVPASASRRMRLLGVVIPLSLLLCVGGVGFMRLSSTQLTVRDGVRLRLVQPSVPQREKWERGKQLAIFNAHLDLSRRNAAGQRDDARGITHIIWPEAAMPFLPLRQPQALRAIGDMLPDGVQLITGALRLEDAGKASGSRRRLYNSMLVFEDTGKLVTLYDKTHLVPFGEYLPYQETLEWLGLRQLTGIKGGFDTGRSPRPLLTISGLPPVGPLICYEIIFPMAVTVPGQRPAFLLNLTNDGWFGNLTGPYQHFHQARVRAVEEGLPLVRVANNGISAVVDGHGRVREWLDLNVVGVIDSGLPVPLAPTIYARFGDRVFLALWLLTLIGFVVCSNRLAGSRSASRAE